MVYQYGESGELIPAKGVPEEAIFALERADEVAIVEQFSTPFAETNLLYSYEIDGKPIIGINVKGGYEVARLLGNLEVMDIHVQEKEDYFYAAVRARDILRNVTLIGVGRCCKYYVGKGNVPTDRLNEHAYVIAISKGQRNSILAVAPQEAVLKIVQTFIEQKKVQKLSPGTAVAVSKKASAPSDSDTLAAARKAMAPTVSDKEKKDILLLLVNAGYNTKEEREQIFKDVTGKDKNWTKDDFDKVKAFLEEKERKDSEGGEGEPVDKEVQDFLGEIPGGEEAQAAL